VAALSALLLTHADDHHLHQAALVLAAEGGVGLHAAYHHDAVGLGGVLVQVDRLALGGRDDDDGLHAGLDGYAHGLFGDAVAGEHLQLALGGGSAVAAHGREDEGLSASFLICSTVSLMMTARLAMPRLPAVMATVIPA
jgi:hypothetical protein